MNCKTLFQHCCNPVPCFSALFHGCIISYALYNIIYRYRAYMYCTWYTFMQHNVSSTVCKLRRCLSRKKTDYSPVNVRLQHKARRPKNTVLPFRIMEENNRFLPRSIHKAKQEKLCPVSCVSTYCREEG